MKKSLLIILIVLCIIIILSATGCGSSKKVPDSMIETIFTTFDDFNYSADYSWSATHNPNSELHTDTVSVSLTMNYTYGSITTNTTASFQYNRASDLWSLQYQPEWSDPIYTFNDNLKGNWNGSTFSCEYDINIISVKDNLIEIECYVCETVYGGLFSGDQLCVMNAYGTYDTAGSSSVLIPLNLPDGFFVSWSDSPSGENEYVSNLWVTLDVEHGIGYTYTTPKIYVWTD